MKVTWLAMTPTWSAVAVDLRKLSVRDSCCRARMVSKCVPDARDLEHAFRDHHQAAVQVEHGHASYVYRQTRGIALARRYWSR